MIRALVVLILLLYAGVALAQEQNHAQQPCRPLQAILEGLKFHVRLDPVQSIAVVAWFNRQPPESNDTFSLVVVASRADGRIGLLLGNDEQVCIATILSPDAVPGLMRAISGEVA